MKSLREFITEAISGKLRQDFHWCWSSEVIDLFYEGSFCIDGFDTSDDAESLIEYLRNHNLTQGSGKDEEVVFPKGTKFVKYSKDSFYTLYKLPEYDNMIVSVLHDAEEKPKL